MLNLDVDEMIIEIFKHFLRSARVHHPKVVVESMEAVMSFMIEESGDESSALLAPIFAILKRNNGRLFQMQRNCLRRLFKIVQRSVDVAPLSEPD